MIDLLGELRSRNEVLFSFGLFCLFLAVVFVALALTTDTQVRGVNAFWKPFKFAVSIAVYSWTMAWICHPLSDFNHRLFAFLIVALLGFEIVYIGVQAARGQLSHFNLSTPFYRSMYVFMALAATLVTVATAYVGLLFWKGNFPSLPVHYVWALRLGIGIFVIFSLEGFVMGSRLSHTIGGPDGGPGLPILNWSTKFGDPRIPHFIGMHALQVLPFLAHTCFSDAWQVFVAAGFYLALAGFTLWQALQGRPLITV